MVTASAPAQPSLRGLARALGVSHASLSLAIRAGRLTAGVMIDQRDRAVVVDAAAAARQWAQVHVPMLRMPPIREAPRPPPAPDQLDVEVRDQHYDRWTTPREVLAERDELALLCSALVATALDTSEAGAIRTMGAAALRRVSELHDADDAAIERAELELASILEMLTADAADDE